MTDENTQNEEIENLRKELEEMSELAKRTMADFHNFRRRQEEEQGMLIKMAAVGLMKSLLPILDNFARAENEATEGLKMCIAQFKKVLEDHGLTIIDPLNQPFNPDFHEALLEGEGEKDHVIEVLEKGYMLGDRVLRHAKVKVGKGN